MKIALATPMDQHSDSRDSSPMVRRDIDTHVGKRLRLQRTIMGLSQEAVAKAVGITFQQVQKYEKGTNAMNTTRIFEFAQFMNVPVSYFFEGLEQPRVSLLSNGNGNGNHHPSPTTIGFSETAADVFEHKTVSDRESLEIIKAFKRIKEHVIRKRVADLIRAIADSRAIVE